MSSNTNHNHQDDTQRNDARRTEPARHEPQATLATLQATATTEPATGTRITRAPSLQHIADMIALHGDNVAREAILAALRTAAPEGRPASEAFYHAVADNRMAFARVLMRLQRYIGGHPGCWLLREDTLRNVQNERKVTLNPDTIKIAQSLISDAMDR